MATKANDTQTKPHSDTTQTNSKQARSTIHRSALAYLGLYGLAYDRFVMRAEQARVMTDDLFNFLALRGEETTKKAERLIKQGQIQAYESYGKGTAKLEQILPMPSKLKAKRLEKIVAALEAQVERMENAVTPYQTKETLSKSSKQSVSKAPSAKNTQGNKKPRQKSVHTVKTDSVTQKVDQPDMFQNTAMKADAYAKTTSSKVKAVSGKAETDKGDAAQDANQKEPRHIQYFNDVKRYDPLADEAIVRKIVNHCGIALNSMDARYVACSDESERATVRESWLKRKLGLAGTDADLDQKVLAVCELMQRDQFKSRVTFYYLLAKKERLLAAL